MIKIPLKAGHHRPASKTPFKWRFAGDDGLTLNSGLVVLQFSGDQDQYCDENLFFVIFHRGGGGGGPDPLFPLWIRPCHSRNFQPCRDIYWVEPVQCTKQSITCLAQGNNMVPPELLKPTAP